VPPGIQRVLIPAEDLTARVGELGRQIRADYAGRTPMLVGVLKGAVVFLADLMRAIDAPCECDFIALSSYGASTRSSGSSS
jgi:hypoxanthine phosphoribosyltransferase